MTAEASGSVAATVSAPADGADQERAIASHLQVLGLAPGASRRAIDEAHRQLVSDLTPGPGASHRNVSLANQLLAEVNRAYDSLQARSSVA